VSQRSYGNDRYRKGAKIGSTRKSAAGAKPVRKQGTVEAGSASKPKQKPGQEKEWSGLPTSPEIKKWRQIWWALLLGGLALIGLLWVVPGLNENQTAQAVVPPIVLVCSLAAVSIDLFIIRKLRKQLIEERSAKKKPSKGAGAKAAEKDASAVDRATSGKDRS
jgi:hypothetical protein